MCVYVRMCAAFVRPCIHMLCTYLVCGHQVDQHSVQQLLRYSVPLTDDGAHKVHHMHMHLLVVAIAMEIHNKS